MADVDVLQLTPKGRATRERIVKTAAELMARQGVAGTSIDDVRRAAGVSGSQMTHYFQDKRTLVRAVIAMQADTVIGLQPSLDSFEALERWAEQNIARQQEANCESGCIFGSLAGELAETDAETRAELAAGFTRWEALFREGLQAMSDRGELRPDAGKGEHVLHGHDAAGEVDRGGFHQAFEQKCQPEAHAHVNEAGELVSAKPLGGGDALLVIGLDR